MPSSFSTSIAPIVGAIVSLQPTRILDVGPGWGKYGLLCREYLPQIDVLDAIEVSQGRLATQDFIYDHVIEADARGFNGWNRYDLVLLIDVIEHMPKADGHELLDDIGRHGVCALVSTPKAFVEQHDEHNPFETHHCLWKWDDFCQHGISGDYSTGDAIIYTLRAPPS